MGGGGGRLGLAISEPQRMLADQLVTRDRSNKCSRFPEANPSPRVKVPIDGSATRLKVLHQ